MEYAVLSQMVYIIFEQSHSTCLMNSFMSTPKLVKCGVPQGTILGLFLLYIDNVTNCLYFSQPRMYADDTSLTFASVDLKYIDDCLKQGVHMAIRQ